MQVWRRSKSRTSTAFARGRRYKYRRCEPDETFNGNVVYVRPNATRAQSGVTFTVIVDVRNSENLLPNQTANLQFEIEQHSVLLVPDDALSKPATLASEGCDADGMAANAAADGKAGPQKPPLPHRRCALGLRTPGKCGNASSSRRATRFVAVEVQIGDGGWLDDRGRGQQRERRHGSGSRQRASRRWRVKMGNAPPAKSRSLCQLVSGRQPFCPENHPDRSEGPARASKQLRFFATLRMTGISR